MAEKKAKKIKVQDLKPKKDAKGGMFLNTPGHNNPGNHGPGNHGPGFNGPGNHGPGFNGPGNH